MATQFVGSQIAQKEIFSSHLADNAIVGGNQFANVVNLDGKAFTGAASFSSPLTVADATAATHVTTKGQVDTAINTAVTTLTSQINALGNAFNLVDEVDGGIDEASAFDMSTLSEKDPGDYYAVTTTGFFKKDASSTPFKALVGDGLVFNMIGDVFKIDNTNSTVAGTTDFISVTGSADIGFTVDIHDTFKTRMTTAESDIGTRTNLATTEKTSLVLAVNELHAQRVAATYVKKEVMTGTIDGVNKNFTLLNTPVTGSVSIMYNGQELDEGDDYTITGTAVVLTAAPQTGQKLWSRYFKQV